MHHQVPELQGLLAQDEPAVRQVPRGHDGGDCRRRRDEVETQRRHAFTPEV